MRAGRKRKAGHRWANGHLRQKWDDEVPGFAAVYVIELGHQLVKIGISTSPQRRAETISATNQHCALICCFWLEENKAKRLENLIHKRFKTMPFHARGELYFLGAEEAIAMIKPMLKDSFVTGIEAFSLTKDQPGRQNASLIARAQTGDFVPSRRRKHAQFWTRRD